MLIHAIRWRWRESSGVRPPFFPSFFPLPFLSPFFSPFRRSFHLDINRRESEGDSFPVFHSVYGGDNRTVCDNVQQCLWILNQWSERSPGVSTLFLLFLLSEAFPDCEGALGGLKVETLYPTQPLSSSSPPLASHR